MKFDIVTIFPSMFDCYLGESILKRAQAKKLLDVRVHDLRKWTTDRHQTVDDKPFGGGPGMVMKVEPFARALKDLKIAKKTTRVILTSASGKPFTQADARRLAKYKRVVILCGRYEGVDERVAEHLADEEISIGPFVLTGGELPAMIMVDVIARHIPGVLGKSESLEEVHGSFPQYTRPEKYRMHMAHGTWRVVKVPEVLMSGDHKKIAEWRRKQSRK